MNHKELRKDSDSQMGFEPMTLCTLVGCSNHRATGDSESRLGFRFFSEFLTVDSCICDFILF